MGLGSEDCKELQTTPVNEDASVGFDLPSTRVNSSDAEISLDSTTVLEDLHVEEPVDHETEFAAKATNGDIIQPDPLIDESRAGSPSTLGVSEDLETQTTEEYEAEFEAEVTKSIIDLLIGDGDVGSHWDTVTVLEHLENGEREEPKMEEFAAEASSANLNLPGSLIDNNDAGSPLDSVIVLEHREIGDCEEPKMEEPGAEASGVDLNLSDSLTVNNVAGSPSDVSMIDSSMLCTEDATKDGDLVEELVVDTDLRNDSELMQSPLEEGVQVVANNVQSTPENNFENNESKSGSIYNTDKNEAREEENHSEKVAVGSTLEGETEYLPSSKHLPLEVGKNVIQLQCESNSPSAPNGMCTINIVGTAHVSKASCEEVEALIRHVKPEVVFLELCSSRTSILLQRKLEVPTFSSMLESYRKKEVNLFGIMYSWFLAKVGEKLEILPGTEFRIAYEEAVKCRASITLGDRPIQVTLKRTWGMMSLWHKTKFLFGILTATFDLPSSDEFHALMEKMEQSDEVTLMIQELSKTFPTLSETLVAERDLYMVATLRTVARRYSSVVAVVGRGHLSGIENHWKEDINVEELLTIPAKKPINRIWFWSTVALGVGGIVVGVKLLRHR